MKFTAIMKKNVLLAVLAIAVTGCSSKPVLEADAVPPKAPMPVFQNDKDNLNNVISDPWEGFNRRMYYFNAKADEYVLIPVVNGYKAVTPDFVETGVSNFFENLGEVSTFVNSLLQFKISVAAETLGRFAVNSTIGLAGLFDVATHVGLEEQNEDFGQTLGTWGVGTGPYLVLPILGPSNVRDASGLLVDTAIYNEVVDQMGLKDDEIMLLNLLKGIDARASNPFRYYSTGSAFEYDRIKLFYTKLREIQIDR